MSTPLRVVRHLFVASTLFVAATGTAWAAPLGYQPTPQGPQQIDHGYVYTWNVDTVSTVTQGEAVRAASIFFFTVTNSTNQTDWLFGQLLNTSRSAGTTAGLEISDSSNSFTTAPTDSRCDVASSQMLKLNDYLNSDGDLAKSLDADCGDFDDGIALTLNTPENATIPEPVTLTLLALGLGAAYARRRAAAHRSPTAPL